MDKLQKLEQIIGLVESDKITHDEFAQIFEDFLNVVKDVKESLESKIDDNTSEVFTSVKEVAYSLSELELKVKDLINGSERSSLVKIKELSQRLASEINRIEGNMPSMPDLSYLEQKILEVESKILPSIEMPEMVMETGVTIVDKINSLDTDNNANKIGIEHINGLLKELEDIKFRVGNSAIGRGMGQGGGLSQVYHDSSLSGTGSQSSPLTVVASSVGYQSPTGTVNGINKVFVFALAPNVISSDGIVIRKTQADGTVMWTGTTTVTLLIAPNNDVFSIS